MLCSSRIRRWIIKYRLLVGEEIILKKYVIRLSASGALCMTSIGCRVSEKILEKEKSESPKMEENCTPPSGMSIEEFLASLDEQGRIDCSTYFGEYRDLQTDTELPTVPSKKRENL